MQFNAWQYEYIASTDIYVDISLCQAITNYNSQLYVYENDCTGTPVACQEDGCQSPDLINHKLKKRAQPI